MSVSSPQPAAAFDRSTSEPALLTSHQSALLLAPAKPQRKTLMSRLRLSPALPESHLGRTASDPNLLRRTSGDQSQSAPPKRRSVLGKLLQRGSSAAAALAVHATRSDDAASVPIPRERPENEAQPVAPTSFPDLQEDTSFLLPKQLSLPLATAINHAELLPDQADAPELQSAPASPRGRTPPVLVTQVSLAQPGLAVGRAASDPSMLSHRPSGMHSVPTTPRRMSLLGRLSRVRRSNSIVPEPVNEEELGQVDQSLDEVPFAEQPFAQQLMAVDSAQKEEASGGVGSDQLEASGSAQGSPEQLFNEQPSAEQLNNQEPFPDQLLAEQPSAGVLEVNHVQPSGDFLAPAEESYSEVQPSAEALEEALSAEQAPHEQLPESMLEKEDEAPSEQQTAVSKQLSGEEEVPDLNGEENSPECTQAGPQRFSFAQRFMLAMQGPGVAAAQVVSAKETFARFPHVVTLYALKQNQKCLGGCQVS